MPLIRLETLIHAPIDRCFDMSRDIDLHLKSTAATKEIAIAGVTSGLIGFGEEVTWQATHFGFRQKLTTRITAFHPPTHFRDSQVRGVFRRFDHDHFFTVIDCTTTLMRDDFDYASPLGFLGKIADRLFLEAYMRSFLETRNQMLKQTAESAPQ